MIAPRAARARLHASPTDINARPTARATKHAVRIGLAGFSPGVASTTITRTVHAPMNNAAGRRTGDRVRRAAAVAFTTMRAPSPAAASATSAQRPSSAQSRARATGWLPASTSGLRVHQVTQAGSVNGL